MQLPTLHLLVAALSVHTVVGSPLLDDAASSLEKRDTTGFAKGQPIDGTGKGAPILGMLFLIHLVYQLICIGGTNHALDIQNPDNLGQQGTDNGVVKNLKWSFSDSKTRIFRGGWTRQQTIDDLPSSHDIAAAQQHLKKGGIRELHWHRVVSVRVNRFINLMLNICRLNGVIYILEVSLSLQLMSTGIMR